MGLQRPAECAAVSTTLRIATCNEKPGGQSAGFRFRVWGVRLSRSLTFSSGPYVELHPHPIRT